LISFAVILSLFVFTENEVAPHFQTCVSQDTADQGNETAENKAPFIVGVIKAQAICSLGLVDRHNGFFAALAGIAVAAFTFTLWVATDQLAKSGQKVFEATERAFVFLDGFDFELTTREDMKDPPELYEGEPEWHRTHPGLVIRRFALQPKWKNSGNTPTKNLKIQIDWRAPPYATIEPKYAYRGPSVPFFIAPKAVEKSEVIEVTGTMALINWSWNPVPPEPMIHIWGRADYEDVFGRKHFVEWCHRVRFSRTGGGPMRPSTIQWGEYNRTDETTNA
jgi:hypothetical protein